jgi:hypothetical protein
MSVGAALIGPRHVTSGGVRLDYDHGFAFNVGGGVEATAGPVHLGLHIDYAADRLASFVSIRGPGDLRYWPHAIAGVGPMLSGGQVCDSSTFTRICNYMVLAGIQLFGGD